MGPFGDSHWVEGHWVERTDWDRGSYSSGPHRVFVYRPRLTYESFTHPTRCPVCGADVFFVECPNGGRVFFNELGWPWEKHQCTDSRQHAQPTPSTVASAPTRARPKWQIEGWVPIEIERVFQEDAWFVLKCKQLEDNQLVRVLVPMNPGNLRRSPAMLSTWSADAFATLSYLDDYGEPQHLTVGNYSQYCLSEPKSVQYPPPSTRS